VRSDRKFDDASKSCGCIDLAIDDEGSLQEDRSSADVSIRRDTSKLAADVTTDTPDSCSSSTTVNR
jgi:hypothetical protein